MAGKISNEIKIGALVLISLFVLIFGFNFLKGKGVFASGTKYYTTYENVGGLTEAANVMINGYKVGKINAIEMQEDRTFKVSFMLNKDIKLSEGVYIQLGSDNLLAGTKVVNLIYPENMPANVKYIAEGSFIPNEPSQDLISGLTDNVKPILSTANKAVSSLDSILLSVNSIVNDNAKSHIDQSLVHIESATRDLSKLATALSAQTANLAGVIQNANQITGNLAQSNGQITNTLNNLSDFSNQLKGAPVQQTLTDLQGAVANLNKTIGSLSNKEGSLGLLVNDPSLYNNLNSTLRSLDIMLTDLKKNPSKYINVSVLGRKVECSDCEIK